MGAGDQEKEWQGGLFTVGGVEFAYSVRINRRRKYPCIIVRERGRLEIESPEPMAEKAARRFLTANEGWIISVFQKKDTSGRFRNGTVTLDGEEVPYYITVNRKRKRIAITIRDDLAIEIRSPVPLNAAEAEFSIADVSKWIMKTRAKKRVWRENLHSRQYAEGETIPFQGRLLTIRHTQSEKKISASICRDELWIALPPGSRAEEELLRLRKAVMDCYAEEILPVAMAIAAASAEAIGVACPRVRFGYQKRRFGSCTPKNGIIINIRIAMAPPPYLEYTIIHEVCHLVERNHQQRFWDLVATLLPTFKGVHDQLQKEGMQYCF